MATTTTNLGLTKPATSEKYSVAVVNTNMDLIDAAVADYDKIRGIEYLQHYHDKIRVGDPVKLIFSGDSTTYGTGLTDVNYELDKLAKTFLDHCCVQGVTTVNSGQESQSAYTWNETYLAIDLAAEPDLYILRWGINDGSYPTATRLATFTAALRAGLATIRASYNADAMSILLMTPNATDDTETGRDAEWYEMICPVIRQAAEDYQCCFADLYHYMENCTDVLWTDVQVNGSHIHPLETANAKCISLISECLCPTLLRRGTETPTTLTGQNSWVAYSGSYQAPAYYKDANGIVHLTGVCKDGTMTMSTQMFDALPAGYRPAAPIMVCAVAFEGATLNAQVLTISTSGVIATLAVTGNDWLVLDGITFRATQ